MRKEPLLILLGALLLLGITRTASAAIYTDTSMKYVWSSPSSLPDDTSKQFTLTGNTINVPLNQFLSAKLLMTISINDNDFKDPSNYDAWFDSATGSKVTATSVTYANKKDSNGVKEYIVEIDFPKTINFGTDIWNSSSLIMNIENNCPAVALDSAELDRTYDPTPAATPEPGTMLLLGTGMVGLLGFKKRFNKA